MATRAEDKYTYLVYWSDAGGEFVGSCLEFPSLSYLSPSRLRAVNGIRVLVKAVVEDVVLSGEEPPKPEASATLRAAYCPPDMVAAWCARLVWEHEGSEEEKTEAVAAVFAALPEWYWGAA